MSSALHARARTGRGQIVDSSLYEAVLQVMESLIPDWQVQGYVRERSGSKLPGIAPSNVYPAQDGDILIGANQDPVFARLCAVMGRPSSNRTPSRRFSFLNAPHAVCEATPRQAACVKDSGAGFLTTPSAGATSSVVSAPRVSA